MANQTATLPASFFGGKPLEEGARCEVEIVGVEGDEVQVRYVPHHSDDKEPEEAGDRTHPQFNSMVDETAGGGY
jgi:hypothetical protein